MLKDDHARMLTPNGAERLVPFSQIRDWQRRGVAAKLGYSFASEKGAKAYKDWLSEKLQAEAVNRDAPPIVTRDPGMAAAAVGGVSPTAGPLGRSDVATGPDPVVSGTGQGVPGGKTSQGAPTEFVPPAPPAGQAVKAPEGSADGPQTPGGREAL